MKKLLCAALLLGLTVASAATSYRVTLYRPTTVNGIQLKAGECKVELRGDTIVLKQGKVSVESAMKIEAAAQKLAATTVGYAGEGTGNELRELRLGGTTSKIILDPAAANAGSK